MITPNECKALDINELICKLEEALGSPLPLEYHVRLALLHGVGQVGKSLSVFNPSPFTKITSWEEELDYSILADLLNRKGPGGK